MIDWSRVLTGVVAYEEPVTALDGDRFERIARGFGDHYEVEWASPDAFRFARGEGYSRLPRWDAFGYVDRGEVARRRAAPVELAMAGANVSVLPAGYEGLTFRLDVRVILAFYAFALIAGWLLVGGTVWPWAVAFVLIYAFHARLVMWSLRKKLRTWMARESWN